MTWEVHTKGGPGKRSFEIAVIQHDNHHGKESYGWFGHDKLLITHNGGPCNWPLIQVVWDKCMVAAHDVADELNAQCDLKHCPFCGGDAVPEQLTTPLPIIGSFHYVSCKRCGVNNLARGFLGFDTADRAAFAWNRRAPHPGGS